MRKLIILFSLLIAFPVSAQEGGVPFETGNKFLRMCENSSSWKLACTSYVLGVYHGSQSGEKQTICLPAGVDTMQLFQVSTSYIRLNPTRSHEAPLPLILEALTSAFPCG